MIQNNEIKQEDFYWLKRETSEDNCNSKARTTCPIDEEFSEFNDFEKPRKRRKTDFNHEVYLKQESDSDVKEEEKMDDSEACNKLVIESDHPNDISTRHRFTAKRRNFMRPKQLPCEPNSPIALMMKYFTRDNIMAAFKQLITALIVYHGLEYLLSLGYSYS